MIASKNHTRARCIPLVSVLVFLMLAGCTSQVFYEPPLSMNFQGVRRVKPGVAEFKLQIQNRSLTTVCLPRELSGAPSVTAMRVSDGSVLVDIDEEDRGEIVVPSSIVHQRALVPGDSVEYAGRIVFSDYDRLESTTGTLLPIGNKVEDFRAFVSIGGGECAEYLKSGPVERSGRELLDARDFYIYRVSDATFRFF